MRFSSEDSRRRSFALALAVYLVTTAVYFACASRSTLTTHTPWNHFALLAESWVRGRLDLGGPPPAYAGMNDFAQVGGKWHIVFPAFPAVLLLPLVAIAGSAERVQDGQFFLWLAGIGPAVLFLVFEKLRRRGFTRCDVRANFILALLFAFGTVYFFTAEQGTVWFAAHVVGVGLAALYTLFAIDAERPFWAGLVLGFGFLTRSPLLFAFPLFVLEAVRVSASSSGVEGDPVSPRAWLAQLRSVDRTRLFRLLVAFGLPLTGCVALALAYNEARFGDPFEFGYRYLTVAWRARMDKWGVFDYHYLGRNLAVILTSLPWPPEPSSQVPLRINAHGLALWVTTPLYLFLLWPRRITPLHWPLWITTAAVALPTLFYQNTGWVQFGYRFSNDYAIFLFALFALGAYRMRTLFYVCAVWSVVVNAFGAVSFNRAGFQKFYFVDGTQRILHQPD